MRAGHTPGPWAAADVRYNRDFRTCLNVMTEDGLRFIAAVSCDPHTDTAQLAANARLIAAAPDILEAAEALLAVCEMTVFSDQYPAECWKMRAAMAKARGDA